MGKRGPKPSRVRLSHEEAVDSVKMLRPFIEFAKTAGMEGVGWAKDCEICGEDPWDIHRQDIVDICLLMGERQVDIAHVWNIPTVKMHWHYQHFIKAFWAQGMGGRVASDGHWMTFPKNGTKEQKAEWYRGQFQLLAYLAQKAKDNKEVSRNLKEAKDCDKMLYVFEREQSNPAPALDVSEAQYARIVDAERRRRQAMLENLTPATKVE